MDIGRAPGQRLCNMLFAAVECYIKQPDAGYWWKWFAFDLDALIHVRASRWHIRVM